MMVLLGPLWGRWRRLRRPRRWSRGLTEGTRVLDLVGSTEVRLQSRRRIRRNRRVGWWWLGVGERFTVRVLARWRWMRWLVVRHACCLHCPWCWCNAGRSLCMWCARAEAFLAGLGISLVQSACDRGAVLARSRSLSIISLRFRVRTPETSSTGHVDATTEGVSESSRESARGHFIESALRLQLFVDAVE